MLLKEIFAMTKFITSPKAETIKKTPEIDESIKKILDQTHLVMHKIFSNYKKIHKHL